MDNNNIPAYIYAHLALEIFFMEKNIMSRMKQRSNLPNRINGHERMLPAFHRIFIVCFIVRLFIYSYLVNHY